MGAYDYADSYSNDDIFATVDNYYKSIAGSARINAYMNHSDEIEQLESDLVEIDFVYKKAAAVERKTNAQLKQLQTKYNQLMIKKLEKQIQSMMDTEDAKTAVEPE